MCNVSHTRNGKPFIFRFFLQELFVTLCSSLFLLCSALLCYFVLYVIACFAIILNHALEIVGNSADNIQNGSKIKITNKTPNKNAITAFIFNYKDDK